MEESPAPKRVPSPVQLPPAPSRVTVERRESLNQTIGSHSAPESSHPRLSRRIGGAFQPNVEPYLPSLRSQGIDPFSLQGHTHLLLLVLTEIVKLHQEVKQLRNDMTMLQSSNNATIEPNASVNLGLPLNCRDEYEEFKTRVFSVEFRNVVVSTIYMRFIFFCYNVCAYQVCDC